MKDIAYYSTYTNRYPRKSDFDTVFVYRGGNTVYKGPLDTWDEVKAEYANGYTIEKVPDDVAYLKARKAYNDEIARLSAEFKADLFEYHDVTGHPKAERVFSLAWDYGHSAGLGEVANYFDDLVDLIKD